MSKKDKDPDDYDVSTWGPSDMAANQADLDAASNPMETTVVDLGGKTFKSEDDAWVYIQKHGLNRVAKAMGGTVGARTIRGKVRIVVDAPRRHKR